MKRELPDLDTPRTKEQIHGAFLLLDGDTFGNGSSPRLARILGTSKSSLDRYRKEQDANGRNWDQQREAIYNKIVDNVQESIVETQSKYKKSLIEKTITRKELIDKKIDLFLNTENFQVNEENLKHLLEISEKIGMNLAKYLQLVEGKYKSGPTFNLNVPPKFLTAEGRRWVERQMNNPSSAIDADFEEIKDDEESMQRKLLNENSDD